MDAHSRLADGRINEISIPTLRLRLLEPCQLTLTKRDRRADFPKLFVQFGQDFGLFLLVVLPCMLKGCSIHDFATGFPLYARRLHRSGGYGMQYSCADRATETSQVLRLPFVITKWELRGWGNCSMYP